MERDTGQITGISERGERASSHAVDLGAANLRCAAGLIASLCVHGVRDFVISSGSRCAPLVVAAGRCRNAVLHARPDERVAGFYALGIAKQSRRPAALICTSGTAAANYFPAIIEARQSGTPLIVITADRPTALRGVGAPQTIDQVNLYGNYPVYFADAPVPETQTDYLDRWVELGRDSVFASRDMRGPAHLNTGFAEPLLPDPRIADHVIGEVTSLLDRRHRNEPSIIVSDSDDSAWVEIANRLARAERPLIICSSQNDSDAVGGMAVTLASRIGAPLIADIASQARNNDDQNVVTHHELFLRDEGVSQCLRPDAILRLGGLPTSKILNQRLAEWRTEHSWSVNPDGPADPLGGFGTHLTANLEHACERLQTLLPHSPHRDPRYTSGWRTIESATRAAISDQLGAQHEAPMFEGEVVRTVCEFAGDDTTVFLSNSMPIRWGEMYAEARSGFPRVIVNRGANGIDGIISTAAGVAMASGRTTFCVTGDVAFLHDVGGLLGLAEVRCPLKIVLLNNNGGGIFDHLPISSYSDILDPYVVMPHQVEFASLAAAYGIPYKLIKTRSQLREELFNRSADEGPAIIEIRCKRVDSLREHRALTEAAIFAARQVLG